MLTYDAFFKVESTIDGGQNMVIFEDVKRIVAENAHTHEGQITVKALGAISWYCRSVKQYVDVCVSYKCNCPAPKQ